MFVYRKTFCILVLVFVGYLYSYYYKEKNVNSQSNDEGTININFTVHILTWNRPHSFQRLITSLKQSHYDLDEINLAIHIDGGKDNNKTIKEAKLVHWPFGEKVLYLSQKRKGLAYAWFSAWFPTQNDKFAIILEDDILLSPVWYKWLKKAWENYSYRDDIAGISLQRQRLIPYKPAKIMEIVNNHEPFLFPLVGSIGFSPHPIRWRQFLSWIDSINLEEFNFDIPYLVTTDSFKHSKKGQIWTHQFVYFCKKYNLFTLYVNLPGKETLAAHMREKGEHAKKTQGQDLPIAHNVSLKFPTKLLKYDWAGHPHKTSTY